MTTVLKVKDGDFLSESFLTALKALKIFSKDFLQVLFHFHGKLDHRFPPDMYNYGRSSMLNAAKNA